MTISAIVSGAPGAIDATGTASHWALVDTGNSRLLAAGALGASQAVTDGNTAIDFTTAAPAVAAAILAQGHVLAAETLIGPASTPGPARSKHPVSARRTRWRPSSLPLAPPPLARMGGALPS